MHTRDPDDRAEGAGARRRRLAPMAWPWRDSAIVCIAGAFVSWALFVACFALLYSVSLAVMALGGSCASGGPYVIETECPEGVVVFAPLSIFGGLLAAALSFLFAQGFGTPLLAWAWPILFVGLSIPFFLSSADGSVVGVLIGVMFAVMGLAPVWFFMRMTDAWTMVLGARSAAGRNFIQTHDGAASRLMGRRAGAEVEPVRPTVGDWMLSLGVVTAAVVAGLLLARWLWSLAA